MIINTEPDQSIIAISDIHGCHNTLLRLLNKCAAAHPGAKLVFLGDLVDRGPSSRQVVKFAMDNKVATTCANHEDILLDYSKHLALGFEGKCHEYYERDIWLYNGGNEALRSWPDSKVPGDVLKWMSELPVYFTFPNAVRDEQGLQPLFGHTGYGLDADSDTEAGWMSALWGRHDIDGGPFPEDDYYRVFGHTYRQSVAVESRHCCIDTGAAYPRYGHLSAFIWPIKEVISVETDETPVEASFKVVDGDLIPL